MLMTEPLYERTAPQFQVISPEYRQYPEYGKEIEIILGTLCNFHAFCEINK